MNELTQPEDADVCRRMAQLAAQTPHSYGQGFAKVGSRLGGLQRIVEQQDGSRLAALLRRSGERARRHDDKVRPSDPAR